MEPLYGQKDLAEFCEFVIASLFDVAPAAAPTTSSHNEHGQREGIDTPPYTPPPEGSEVASSRKEPPLLVEFIAYALYRTRLPTSIVHQSLLLLSRLKARYPSARGTSSSPHRLFLSSLMLSAKISMDDTYSNKSWAIVGSSFFPLREVNQMERELFAFLGWNVVAQQDELDSFIQSAMVSYEAAKASKKAERVKRRRMEDEEARESRHRQATNAARALLRPHTYRHSPSPTRSSSSPSECPSVCSSAAGGVYTPASVASPAMQASPVASTSSQATSPQQQYQFSSNLSSAQAQQAMSSSSSSSCSNSRAGSPHGYSTTHPHYPQSSSIRTPYTPSSSSSISSSAVSSAFPSATHSPTSPASEPFSAGPQTPDSDFHYLHHAGHAQAAYHSAGGAQAYHQHASAAARYNAMHSHAQQQHHHEVSSDFPEADSYMASKQQKTRTSISPPAMRKSYHHHHHQASATSPSFINAFSQHVQA